MSTRPIQYDAIDTIRCLGYSERQASFIYTVAVHSGYFLRRQFNFAVQRQRGWIAASFLAKAKRAGHVREIECGPSRLLYQLCSKQIYRIVGQRNSPNRRPKSPRETRRRLIMLDYVLTHLGKQQFLETDASRHKFFAQFSIKGDALTSANKFSDLLPVSVQREEKGLTVLFTFIDEGQRSIAKFERFLSTHDKLLCSLPSFAVVYVAVSPELFGEARHLFKRLFPSQPLTSLKKMPVINGHTLPTIPKDEIRHRQQFESYGSEDLIRPATADVLLQFLEDRVTSLRKTGVTTAETLPNVYVVCSPSEWDEALRLKACSESDHRFAAVLPIREVDDKRVRRRDHRDTLKNCQAALVYWGAKSQESWFREEQREVINARLKRRARPHPVLCLSSPPRSEAEANNRSRPAIAAGVRSGVLQIASPFPSARKCHEW